MQDVPVYAVVNLHVTDATVYRQYEKGFFPMLKKHGGEFVTFDDAAFTLEGAAPRSGRMIIFKFASAARYRGPGGSGAGPWVASPCGWPMPWPPSCAPPGTRRTPPRAWWPSVSLPKNAPGLSTHGVSPWYPQAGAALTACRSAAHQSGGMLTAGVPLVVRAFSSPHARRR